MTLSVTFAEVPPADLADQIVVRPASMRSIADYADVEQRLKAGGITKVVIVATPTTGLRAWADSLLRAAHKESAPLKSAAADPSPEIEEVGGVNLELWASPKD
jgi:hypothetical protein